MHLGESQAEQAIDPGAPGIQLAGRVSVCVDDAGGSTDALQADRLPHQQQFGVARRLIVVAPAVPLQATGPVVVVQVGSMMSRSPGLACVDRSLDRVRCGYVVWSLAADGDGDRVNG